MIASNVREIRLASILRALDQLDSERAEWMTDFKNRRVKLENELKDVCNDILTGQTSLIDEMDKEKHEDSDSALTHTAGRL